MLLWLCIIRIVALVISHVLLIIIALWLCVRIVALVISHVLVLHRLLLLLLHLLLV